MQVGCSAGVTDADGDRRTAFWLTLLSFKSYYLESSNRQADVASLRHRRPETRSFCHKPSAAQSRTIRDLSHQARLTPGTQTYPHRVNVRFIDLLELQAGVGRILAEERIRESRKSGVGCPKSAGCGRFHPVDSSRGRVSPRLCSSTASRARERSRPGCWRNFRAQVSSSSKD
jgi:hypothetical protein